MQIAKHPSPMQYWLVKQEPEAYSWTDFVKDGGTAWTGVRNFSARNNLRAMKVGDLVFFYHSGEKLVVGLAQVQKEAYADPTAKEGDWSCVDLKPVKPLKTPVSLEQIRSDKILRNNPLVSRPRLSVVPVAADQFERLLQLAETKL